MEEDPQELSYSSEHIEQLLQCAICLDRFKQPKLLPCQHTFCETPCLENLVNFLSRSIKCPECRAEHRVPYQGVSSFPNNLTIRNFLEIPTKRIRRTSGGSGGDGAGGSTVASGSTSAAGGSGGACASSVGGQYINAVAQDREPPTAAASRSGCTICTRETTLSRCAHCDQVVCDACKRSHMDHIKLDVARLVGQIRRGIPHMSDAVNHMEIKIEALRQRSESGKAEITEIIEKYIAELRSRQRLLHSEVEMFLLGEVRALRMHQENLEVEMASIASFCDTNESTLSRSQQNTSDEGIVEDKKQCVEYMELLRSYELGNYPLPRERSLQFYMEENRLSNVIAGFGEIVTNNSQSTSESQSSASSRDSSPVVSLTNVVTTTPSLTTTTTPSTSTANSGPMNTDRALALIRGGHHLSAFTTPSPAPDSDSEARSSPLPRRTLQERRRGHMSDTRIAGLMAGGGGGGGSGGGSSSPRTSTASALRERRLNRSLSTGASLFTPVSSLTNQPSTSIQEEPSASPSPRPRRAERSNTFSREESNTASEVVPQTSRVSSADARPRARPPVRFDVGLDDNGDQNELPGLELLSFSDNESCVVTTATNNYQDKGRAIIRFGQRGTDFMQFTWPRGVATTRENNILVADSSNHRVQVFDSVGKFVKVFGSYGQGEGEFDCLSGIAVNSFGQVIISDRYNHRIQVYNRHCEFELAFGTEGSDQGQMLNPWGVACDNMGFIYVCDKENHRVQVFQTNGRFVRMFGALGHRSGLFENPHFVAISPDNKIFVSDSSNHRVQVFSMYGDFLFAFGCPGTMEGQMRFPKGIAIDDQGFVVVADSGNNRVQVFRGNGRFYCMFGSYGSDNGQFKGIEGVAILGNGNIIISDRENHRIQIF
ncbi:RING finger protein nhl-1-like [Mizuhopecten yessoensis]|uniref:RING finger protein nhl-1 n=1 Tax=Mizuhopecten yessoensis TaxID=6573 RepID=A0A210Q0T1_MIZYE|nr:RING finger protein nhl-1-like [Mizuhopecten yessoensis]XP_021370242.1 RING finger protein nhl-1-like [Mizuhopecten yessoensis]OWF42353.1 RING finger protein nhl-1 [Mizuhopecten yessoensis]